MKKNKLLYNTNEWSFDTLEKTLKVIEKIATEKYGLTYYEPQLEIVSADQMIGHTSGDNGGLPFDYNHWSYGKQYFRNREGYDSGRSGLPYELIINSDPAQAFLIDSNTMTTQALTIAHASIGHSSFFKNNYFIKENMNAKFILPFMNYANNFIKDCEKKYNTKDDPDYVEHLLDKAHMLYLQGIDKVERKRVTKDQKYNKRVEQHYADEKIYNPIFNTKDHKSLDVSYDDNDFDLPESNVLYFIEKYSPVLADWEREILRIVRKKAQYIYPNICTKVMNEGYASFWHYHIMHDLYDEGYISEGSALEFLSLHTGVCNQHPHTANMNPYVLGFNIFMDIKRICLEPTEEDRELFPYAGNKNWIGEVEFAMRNFIDSSFVLQYLSPHLCRKMKLYTVGVDSKEDYLEINNIHDVDDFKRVRHALSEQYKFSTMIPEINIMKYDPYHRANGDWITPIFRVKIDLPEGFVLTNEYIDILNTLSVLMGCEATYLNK